MKKGSGNLKVHPWVSLQVFYSASFLLSMGYVQGKALIKPCVADGVPLDLTRSSTFIASETNKYYASPKTHVTKLKLPNYYWHDIRSSPQLPLKADTGRFPNWR